MKNHFSIFYVAVITLLFSHFAQAQSNFWHSMTNPCSKNAISCLAHYQNRCKADGIYLVKNVKVTCSMSTGGGQLVPSSSLDIAKVQAGKQYITIPAGVIGDQAGVNLVTSGVRVSALYSLAKPSVNLTVGKSVMNTSASTSCHVGTINTCYNYIQEINAFINRGLDLNDFGIIVFATKVVGRVTAANDGYGGDHAYIYYRTVPPATYSVFELP